MADDCDGITVWNYGAPLIKWGWWCAHSGDVIDYDTNYGHASAVDALRSALEVHEAAAGALRTEEEQG